MNLLTFLGVGKYNRTCYQWGGMQFESSFSSTFSTIDGYLKNIKFAMGRLQDTADDIKRQMKHED